jgi:hypothetical protein
MRFVFIWEQTATCPTYIINWLVFITEMKSVYSAVRTGSLNKAVCVFVFKWLIYPWNKPRVQKHYLHYSDVSRYDILRAVLQYSADVSEKRNVLVLQAKHSKGNAFSCRRRYYAPFETSVQLDWSHTPQHPNDICWKPLTSDTGLM